MLQRNQDHIGYHYPSYRNCRGCHCTTEIPVRCDPLSELKAKSNLLLLNPRMSSTLPCTVIIDNEDFIDQAPAP